MSEENAFDRLLNYLSKNRLEYETHLSENRFLLSPSDPLLNTRYITFRSHDLIFCAYDSFTVKSGSTQTFSGIYSAIRLKPEQELKLMRKHWIDLLLISGKQKSGIEVIDRNFTISASGSWNFQVLLSEKVAHLFSQLEREVKPLNLIIKHDYLPMVGELRGKQVIGIETNHWISQREEIEALLHIGGKLIGHIKQSAARFF